MIAVYFSWEGPSFTPDDLLHCVTQSLNVLKEYGSTGDIRLAAWDVGLILWSDTEDVTSGDTAASVGLLDDVDEFSRNTGVEIIDIPEEELWEATSTQVSTATPEAVIRACHGEGWVDDYYMNELGFTTPSESVQILASRIHPNPKIILEDIESDLRVFVNMNVTKLRVKEQAFEVGHTRWDDPGDYPSGAGGRALPSYEYVEDIYGGAELAFDIPIENIPPHIRWRIEHTEAPVRKYTMEGQHIQRIASSISRKTLGILVLSDEQGNEAKADVGLLMDALDEELYRVKQDLDELMMPPDNQQTYTLQIVWANWEYEENKLTCTIGVSAELD